MIASVNVLKSVVKKLKDDIETTYGIPVFEASQKKLYNAVINAGTTPAIVVSLGTARASSVNHPKTRLDVYITMKNSDGAILAAYGAHDYVMNSFAPLSSFPLYDYDDGGVVVSYAVVVEAARQKYYTDNDRNIVLPIFFVIGYGNVFN